MEARRFYVDDFIIYLTIDGTSHEDVMVRVTDPYKTIRAQIISIVQAFELPKVDNGSNPIQYLLGKMSEDGEETEILDFEDEDGRELCLMDYNIQLGDNLHLISVPVCGRQPIKVQVTGIDSNISCDEFVINNGRLWDGSVGDFLKYIIETFHFPIFNNGYYIDYSLSIWDGNRRVKCNPHERLWNYIAILIRNDTTPYGNYEFDLRMFLSAEKSRYRNRLGAFFEKCHQYCGQIIYNNINKRYNYGK